MKYFELGATHLVSKFSSRTENMQKRPWTDRYNTYILNTDQSRQIGSTAVHSTSIQHIVGCGAVVYRGIAIKKKDIGY